MNGLHSYGDELLVQLLKEGDEHAFNEIYSRYWRMLFGIASSKLRNNRLAEDIIHDVFASLWKARRNSDILSLQHYLTSATRYLVFKAIRKTNSEQCYLQTRQELCEKCLIENAIHNKYLLQFINREIETLPERCRKIFKYSRNQGMSNREIAKEMQISLKTVENQISKALHQLRFSMKRILQEYP